MTTKLTLSIEADLVLDAKAYARLKNRSLSELVENYFRLLTIDVDAEMSISPEIRKLQGTIKAPDDFDHKKVLREELAKRHGK